MEMKAIGLALTVFNAGMLSAVFLRLGSIGKTTETNEGMITGLTTKVDNALQRVSKLEFDMERSKS